MINLSFWTFHAGERSKIKVFWMNTEDASFIVPKISFFIDALTLHSLNVESLIFWARLTYFSFIVVDLTLIAFITDGVFEEEWLCFGTCTFLVQT